MTPSLPRYSSVWLTFLLAASGLLLFSLDAWSACGSYCRNVTFRNNGSDFDGTDANGWFFLPFLPVQSILATQNDGTMVNANIFIVQAEVGTSPSCGGNGVYQEGTQAGQTVSNGTSYTVEYKCANQGS